MILRVGSNPTYGKLPSTLVLDWNLQALKEAADTILRQEEQLLGVTLPMTADGWRVPWTGDRVEKHSASSLLSIMACKKFITQYWCGR